MGKHEAIIRITGVLYSSNMPSLSLRQVRLSPGFPPRNHFLYHPARPLSPRGTGPEWAGRGRTGRERDDADGILKLTSARRNSFGHFRLIMYAVIRRALSEDVGRRVSQSYDTRYCPRRLRRGHSVHHMELLSEHMRFLVRVVSGTPGVDRKVCLSLVPTSRIRHFVRRHRARHRTGTGTARRRSVRETAIACNWRYGHARPLV